MKKFVLLLAVAVIFSFAGFSMAQEQSSGTKTAQPAVLTVIESAVSTGIADRQPDGASTQFSKDISKLYYWTKIEGATESQIVKHVWRSNGNVIGEISLTIDKPSFRTWSSKTITPELVGTDMSVEVVDSNGNVLKKDSFKIQ